MRRAPHRIRAAWLLGAAAALLALSAAPAEANWTATGRFVYVDREYDQTGFTGAEPQRPVRSADVQILDSRNRLLASGATDANGFYSIAVVDSSQRTVYARATTKSAMTPDLFIDVRDTDKTKYNNYAVRTANVSGHNPNVNVNFGTIVALTGQGGEAFNIYDQLLIGADYIASLRGSRPGSADSLSAVWAVNRGITDSYYSRFTRRLNLRDTAAYDDTAILHEMGHFFVYEYSASDSPAGAHTFSMCVVDIRLAYDEGYATYWGNSALRNAGFPICNIYMRSNGGPGPGNLVRYADLETDTQYFCEGSTSEVVVFTLLWDINDSASTTDTTPGADDAGDALALPDAEAWEVQRDAMPAAANKSLEDFWDGWFAPPIANGHLAEMSSIAALAGVDFAEDAFEANNTVGTASALSVGGGPAPATFFYDPDGDGAGQEDADYFVFTAAEGLSYRAQTTGLTGDANTLLELIDSDGVTVIASNDDRAVGDDSSSIDWTAPRSDVFYLRVTHAPDLGIHGSYDLSVDPL